MLSSSRRQSLRCVIHHRTTHLAFVGILWWTSLPLLAQSDGDSNWSPTWSEAVAAYTDLQAQFPTSTELTTFGTSDVGRPLHLFTLGNPDAGLRLLVNNAIHPGEPCGVNASIQWATRLLESGSDALDQVYIGIVPMYNVGGGLRRNCCTRANQNGPEEYGFRGNARNLDLNRDFIKCDSRNALGFNAMLTAFEPDLFVDTHTSNGADYPATLTLITTQPDKLGGELGAWVEAEFVPELMDGMEKAGPGMVPYVYSLGPTPEDGIQDFLETPRFSTGYAALHHAIGFTTEAHMLKPFPERVQATLHFLDVLLAAGLRHAEDIRALRVQQEHTYRSTPSAPVAWALDTNAVDSLRFRGYAARYEWSAVTGERRLRYDRDSIWDQNIAHFHTFRATAEAPVPAAYIVPQAWRHVIERLQANGVEHHEVPADTTLVLEVTHILAHHAIGRPYEGHHVRTLDSLERRLEPVQLFAGDWVIPVDQKAARYLIETLSPEAVDAFFTWNFFDSALQQKEYFSSYVFEDTARELVKRNPELRTALDQAKAEAEQEGRPMGGRAQLQFLYERSPHSEGTANRYPVFSVPFGQPTPFE